MPKARYPSAPGGWHSGDPQDQAGTSEGRFGSTRGPCLGPVARYQVVSADCQDVLGAMATALPTGEERSVAGALTVWPGWRECVSSTRPYPHGRPGLGRPVPHP